MIGAGEPLIPYNSLSYLRLIKQFQNFSNARHTVGRQALLVTYSDLSPQPLISQHNKYKTLSFNRITTSFAVTANDEMRAVLSIDNNGIVNID